MNFWSPHNNTSTRITSSIVTGLPSQVWTLEAFSCITESLGETLIPEECGLDNSNLAAGRIVVLMNCTELINDIKKVLVDVL